jgi:predicted PurR-regulated permease PerM
MAMPLADHPLERILGLAAFALLLFGCFVVLKPFLAAILWAVILVLVTWPAYQWLRERLGGRRNLAALLMVLGLTLGLLVPFAILAASLTDDAGVFAARVREAFSDGIPGPPAWLADLPAVGTVLSEAWIDLQAGRTSIVKDWGAVLSGVRSGLVKVGSGIGNGLLELGLSVFLAYFIYRDGEAIRARVDAVADRLGSERGLHLLGVAEATMKGVVWGIVGTAVAQGTLTFIGLAIAGIASSLVLGIAAGFLSLIPAGSALIWIPAGVVLIVQGKVWWGVFLLAWGVVVVSSVDNVLKPFFISRGSDLPLALVILGVLGGVAAFGFLGVFLGPTLLAVGFTLMREWSGAAPGPGEPGTADPQPEERPA